MVGATDSNAGAVLPELVKRSVTVRALVRNEQRGLLSGGNALVLRTILGREPRSRKEYFHELATHQA
jgi:hypothetical protein